MVSPAALKVMYMPAYRQALWYQCEVLGIFRACKEANAAGTFLMRDVYQKLQHWRGFFVCCRAISPRDVRTARLWYVVTVVKPDFPFVSFTIYGEFLLRVLNELWFVSSRHLAILIFGDWLPQVNGFVESSTVYCRGSRMCQHRDDVDNSNLFIQSSFNTLISYYWLMIPRFSFWMGVGETSFLWPQRKRFPQVRGLRCCLGSSIKLVDHHSPDETS